MRGLCGTCSLTTTVKTHGKCWASKFACATATSCMDHAVQPCCRSGRHVTKTPWLFCAVHDFTKCCSGVLQVIIWCFPGSLAAGSAQRCGARLHFIAQVTPWLFCMHKLACVELAAPRTSHELPCCKGVRCQMAAISKKLLTRPNHNEDHSVGSFNNFRRNFNRVRGSASLELFCAAQRRSMSAVSCRTPGNLLGLLSGPSVHGTTEVTYRDVDELFSVC